MPPRKENRPVPSASLKDGSGADVYEAQATTVELSPPGPLTLEVRVGPAGGMPGKIMFSQRVHSYAIDQQTDKAVITGALHPTTPCADE